jgi:hypothetical protein
MTRERPWIPKNPTAPPETIKVGGKTYHLKKVTYYRQGDYRDYQYAHGHVLHLAEEEREKGYCTQVVFTHFNPEGKGFGKSAVYVGPARVNTRYKTGKYYR